jgi:hypothetical protein
MKTLGICLAHHGNQNDIEIQARQWQNPVAVERLLCNDVDGLGRCQ